MLRSGGWARSSFFQCRSLSKDSRHSHYEVHEQFQGQMNSIASPLAFIDSLFSSSPKEQQLLPHVAGRHVLKQLKHPLLQEYKFDPIDFFEGSKFACKRILECLYAKDLQLCAQGNIHQGRTKAFLEDVCSASALQSFLDHVKHGYGGICG